MLVMSGPQSYRSQLIIALSLHLNEQRTTSLVSSWTCLNALKLHHQTSMSLPFSF